MAPVWKPAILVKLEESLERFSEESRRSTEALGGLLESSKRLQESSERHRQAYEDQRQFMREALLRLEKRDRETSRFFELHAAKTEASIEEARKLTLESRELMLETRDDVREEMRQAREDDRAVREGLFALIDEIRSWRGGPGPATA